MACGKMAMPVYPGLSRSCTLCKTDNKHIHSDIFCMDCETYYCDECFDKFHKKVPHGTKHVILKNEEIDIWTKVPYKCKTHHDRRFEFFCGEHHDLCCQVCVSLQHRLCEHMKYNIQEAADTEDFRQKNEDLLQKTVKQMDAVQLEMEELETKTVLNDTSKEHGEECVKEFRSRMNHMLDNLEIQANEAINVRYSNNKESLDKMEASLEKLKADLDDLKQQLTSSLTPDKSILAFISRERGEAQLICGEQTLSLMKTALPQMKFSLILDRAIEVFFQNVESIGIITDDDARKVACSSEYIDDITSSNGSKAVDTNYTFPDPKKNRMSGCLNQQNPQLHTTTQRTPQRRLRTSKDFEKGAYSVGGNSFSILRSVPLAIGDKHIYKRFGQVLIVNIMDMIDD